MPDFLAGQPPRPATPVPGLWLLDTPPTIHIRVYTSDPLLDPLDPLDNTHPNPPILPITPDTLLDRLRSDPLERAWLALNNTEPALNSSLLLRPTCVVRPGERRELWVFSPDDAPLDFDTSSLTEQPRPASINVAAALTCPEHGHATSCLETSCNVTFTPPETWTYLEAAAGEALAWRQGVRIFLLPSPLTLPTLDVKLRPTPSALLLTAHPRVVENTEPLLLRPLGLAAILVSPHTTTTAQDARLSAAFDVALGGGWKTGRMETRIAMQAAGERASDWSIYFVPVGVGGRSRGVLTVWPTHLARPGASPAIPIPKPPVGGVGVGGPPEILATAAGLFEFLSSYTAPAEEEEEEEEVEGPSLVDIPEPEEEKDGDADDDSVDDLFSAHSEESVKGDVDTQSDALFPSSAFPSPKGEIDLDVDGLFEEVAALPEAPKIETAAVTQVSSRAVSPRFSITEDDFNFFDSPAPPDTSPEVDIVERMEVVEEEPEDKPAEVDLMVVDEEPQPEPIQPSVPPERPLKRILSLSELVPEAFAPLPLERYRRPRFAYGLPSPAATISIRAELVERLRKSNSDDKYDYAAGWDVDSDSSEVETHSEMTTGAPPTPTSTASVGDRTPARQASVPPPPDNEVEYDGTLCVGSEWTSLRGDEGVANSLARAWGSAWDPVPRGPLSPGSPVRAREDPLASLDVEALANAVVRNRFFRSLFETEDQEPQRPLLHLVKSGVALSDLAPVPEVKLEDEDATPRQSYTLPQTNVNVGYGSAVMRISVAALRYWRELGLEPAGGPKDVKAFAICAPGEDSERVAASFLADMSEVYSSHQLGQHDIGDGDDAGVIPSTTDGIPDAIDKAHLRSSRTVVYVLLPGGKMSRSLLAPLFAPAKTIHIVPVSSIRVQNLTSLAFEVYDAIPRSVDRVFLHGKPIDAPSVSLPYHAFTLCSEITKPELSMTWPQRNYDVLNRWRLVHAAYAFIPALDLLLLSMVDSQGDACEIKAITLESGHTWRERVERAWDIFSSFAHTASAEWRLAICSYGIMSPPELEAWCTLLDSKKDPVTLMTCEIPRSPGARTRPPVSNIPPSAFANSSASIVDETLVGGAAVFTHRMPLDLIESPSVSAASSPTSTPTPRRTIYPSSTFISTLASQSGMASTTTLFHVVFHRAAPRDDPLGGEMHRLACLARRRYALDAPLHLAAVGAASAAVVVLAKGCGVVAKVGDGPGRVVEREVVVLEDSESEKEEVEKKGDGEDEKAEKDEEKSGEEKDKAQDGEEIKEKDGKERPSLTKSESSSSVESVAVPLAQVTGAS